MCTAQITPPAAMSFPLVLPKRRSLEADCSNTDCGHEMPLQYQRADSEYLRSAFDRASRGFQLIAQTCSVLLVDSLVDSGNNDGGIAGVFAGNKIACRKNGR